MSLENGGTPLTMPVVPAYGGYNNNSGMFGDGNGAWWIIILFLFVFCGWGGNGWGGNGGGQGGYDTRADLQRGFDNQAVISKLDGITNGICDSTYALNNAITTGFGNAELSRCNQQAALMQQLNAMQMQNQQCCCDTQRAIDGVNYNMAKNTCDIQNTLCNNTRDIIENQNSNSRAILDFLTQDKIATLTAENQSLKFQASQTAQNAYIAANQEAQTAELIRRLGRDCPVPAYVVPNPNCCYGNQFGYYGYGQNNGGCNNGGCGCC